MTSGWPWALKEVRHIWPDIEFVKPGIKAVCPVATHQVLLGDSRSIECPACEAEVPKRVYRVVYALTFDPDNAICLRIDVRDYAVLRRWLTEGDFELATGRRLRVWVDSEWKLHSERLGVQPVNLDAVSFADDVRPKQIPLRPDKLNAMAAAYRGWLKAGMPTPLVGQSVQLRRLLPTCTLICIPWGCKGPQTPGWQNTSWSLMQSAAHRDALDCGNIGLLCGQDGPAIRDGLISDGVVIGLDLDDDDFAAEALASNPWLNRTFSVVGGRAAKYFFKVVGPGSERCLQTCKFFRSGIEVGSWLSTGSQGVVLGLHPSGRMYEPIWNPLVEVQAGDFALPAGYELGIARKRIRNKWRVAAGVDSEAAGEILDFSLLLRVISTTNGTQAQCPACVEEGKDSAGDNLLIYPDGRYCCARFINADPLARHEHNQFIYRLVGLDRDDDVQWEDE